MGIFNDGHEEAVWSLNEELSDLKAYNEKLRMAVMVAVVQLYEVYPDDVLEAFTLDQLQLIVDETETLKDRNVETIYKEAIGMIDE